MNIIQKGKQIYKNNQNLFNNIFGSGFIRLLAIFISLMTTPAYMRYFSNQAILGVWLTVISVADTITSLDLGLGIGLRNKLTEAISTQKREESKTLISSSYVLMGGIILLLSPILLVLINTTNIEFLFKGVSSMEIPQLRLTLNILVISVLLQMMLRLINSVLYALQQAALVNIVPLITSVVMLLYALIAPSGTDVNNLQNFAIVYFLASNIPYVVLNVVLFKWKLEWCRPCINKFDLHASKAILKLGVLFFYLTLMSMITHSTNELLISSLINTASVVEYQIYNKIFNMITSVVNVILVPLWSATTKALALKDYIWLDKMHKILSSLALGVLLLGVLVIPFMQFAIDIWLGDNSIEINPLMALPFAVFIAENAFNGASATVANGANWIKVQVWMCPISACLNFPLTWIFNSWLDSWISIVLANIVSLIPITIAQFAYVRYKISKEKREVLESV